MSSLCEADDLEGSSSLCLTCKETARIAHVDPDDADFGDILAVPTDAVRLDAGERASGLVTTTGTVLGSLSEHFSPFERVILQASGNLQSIASAWFGKPIVVKVIKNEEVPVPAAQTKANSHLFDRKVQLLIGDPADEQLFAEAHSAVVMTSDPLYEAVKSGSIGLGQLFRSVDSLPRFTLLSAGRAADGGVWRLYDLRLPFISTRILESFPAASLHMPPSLGGG
eukprot:Rhum_TRINITY_DN9324_c0_g1::Rhum_TRINITY_DN9324_c0_g1_i1::g.32955::m.32955